MGSAGTTRRASIDDALAVATVLDLSSLHPGAEDGGDATSVDVAVIVARTAEGSARDRVDARPS